MEIFDGPYYRTNKLLLTCLGQWPYQNPLHKRIIRITVLLLYISIIIPEIFRVMEISGDMGYIIECGSIFGVQTTIGLKFCNYIVNGDKIEMLTNRIHYDWKTNVGPELEIIKKYANEGKKLTKYYSVYMYTTLAAFLVPPVVPIFLDLVTPLNETREIAFPLPTKYGNLDEETYFWPIMLHADCYAALIITIIVAMDATYAVYVQHGCGLFAALGHKLERLMEIDSNEGSDQHDFKRQEELNHQAVISCVKMHNEAIEYANILESSHYVLYFFVIGLIVICMSMSGYQMVMNLDKPGEAIRFGAFTIGQVTHIFFLSWPGQKLTDHSEQVHEWAYQAKWYKGSERSKKLLLLMMIRSREPCRLTAGKLYIMSLANFSMIIRTSLSYFTVLTSFT